MASSVEQIVSFSNRHNAPIKEFFKYPVLKNCEELVAKPEALSLQDRKRFVKQFIVLANGTKTHRVRSGSVTALDSQGEEFWNVCASELDNDGNNPSISFKDDENSYSLYLDEPQTKLHITPHEEGIWASTKPLNEDELKEWLKRALEIYKNNKLPFPEGIALYDKWRARRQELGVIDYRAT